MGSVHDCLSGLNGHDEKSNAITKQKLPKTSHPNPSLQVTADHCIKMQEAPVREPGPGEALIHVKRTGICG